MADLTLLPRPSLMGIFDYTLFFVTFGVTFAVSSVIWQNLGADVQSRWGR